MGLRTELRDGEAIWVGSTRIALTRTRNGVARLVVDAPKELVIALEKEMTSAELRGRFADQRAADVEHEEGDDDA